MTAGDAAAEEVEPDEKRARCDGDATAAVAEDPTSEAASAATERVRLLDAANKQLLQELCDGGDFLTGDRRASIVREVLASTASDPACRQLFKEGKDAKPSSGVFELVNERLCVFAEPADCHGLGKVVLALANLQHILNAEWYEAAAEGVWQALDALGELPEAAKAVASKDEKAARLAEVINVVAGAVGIRAWYRSMGKDLPALPPTGGQPPRFTRVADFCPSGFDWKGHNGWGAQVPDPAVTQEVLASHGIARPAHVYTESPVSPMWKWEPAPGTSTQCSLWMAKMYPPSENFEDFASTDMRHGPILTRVNMEFIAAAYTKNMGCSF